MAGVAWMKRSRKLSVRAATVWVGVGSTDDIVGTVAGENQEANMSIKLLPVDQQTIVITGASSGIGLATARLAAERGAQVVLAARDAQMTSHSGIAAWLLKQSSAETPSHRLRQHHAALDYGPRV